jgi:positive regulator of sigma E activity
MMVLWYLYLLVRAVFVMVFLFIRAVYGAMFGDVGVAEMAANLGMTLLLVLVYAIAFDHKREEEEEAEISDEEGHPNHVDA